jgi:uncharacterized delta-60 repeat protein
MEPTPVDAVNGQRWASIACALVLCAIVPESLAARPASNRAGSLDRLFAVGGKATVDFGGDDSGYALALQRDGKIVLAGWTTEGRRQGYDFGLARLKSNGGLDPSFGSRGKTTVDFGGRDSAWAVALQPDGKIVVVGGTTNGRRHDDFAVARLKPNGALDASFGVGGKVTVYFGSYENAAAVTVQPDGKIVVAGSGGLARLTPSGALDPSFGAGGKYTAGGLAVALQPDGKLVLFDSCQPPCTPVTRLNADATPDLAFGGGTIAVDFLKAGAGPSTVALQRDGKILLAGTVKDRKFAVVRLNQTGSLDRFFGSRGRATVSFGGRNDGAKAVAVEPDGKIVVAGTTSNGDYNFALARFSRAGVLDRSFGVGGKTTVNFGGGDAAYGLALYPDGRIVVGGWATPKDKPASDFAVARLHG